MMSTASSLSLSAIAPLQDELEQHPLYAALQQMTDLRLFMSHHVFSVWDFMSLIKYLQRQLAPINTPWRPVVDPQIRYFINQLVLEEESDRLDIAGQLCYGSHFEFYCQAMQEIGIDSAPLQAWIQQSATKPLAQMIQASHIPPAARNFLNTTFCFIQEDKPHVVAAALALGREHIIPRMFRRFLASMAITAQEAPIFHAYLERHIYLDEDFHAPLSLQLLEQLCAGDEEKLAEAEAAAEEALCARLRFWDGILEAIESASSDTGRC
jgi:hypothetical protein